MLLFKRIYKSRMSPNFCVKVESIIVEHEDSHSLEDHYSRAIDDEAIQLETRCGWCSWGF